MIFTILSLQNTGRDAGHILKSRGGLNTLRWDFGSVKVDDFILFINLMATVEPSPKILTVMPTKCPGRKQVIINSGRGPGVDGELLWMY